MEWMKCLQRAIDYMEEHLEDAIDYEEIGRQAYSSSFHFQRVFHMISGYSVGEYIRNRRLTLAGPPQDAGAYVYELKKVVSKTQKDSEGVPESYLR